MVSEANVEKVENIMENCGNFMIAGMMEALGGILGEMGQGFDDLFRSIKGEAPDADRTIAHEIRQRLSPVTIEAIEELLTGEAEFDMERRDEFIRNTDDDAVVPIIAAVEKYEFGLPRFTEKMTPEGFAGYLYLAHSEDERFDQMMCEVMPALQRLG